MLKQYWRLILFVVVVAAFVGGLIWAGIHFFGGEGRGEQKVYDAAIQLKDRTNSDPAEDARSSAKKGDVILVRETGRDWSDTEKASYLIIRIKLDEEEAGKIVSPKTKKLSKDEAKEKGILNDEILKDAQKEELDQLLQEDILFRAYRVDIDKLGLNIDQIQKDKKLPEKEFDWSVVEKKE